MSYKFRYKFYTLDNELIKESDVIDDNFTGIITHTDSLKVWVKNGKDHREDGPAVIWADGSKFWCINDLNHRIDGPAIEWGGGNKEWYIHGKKCSKEEHKLLSDLMKLKGLL